MSKKSSKLKKRYRLGLMRIKSLFLNLYEDEKGEIARFVKEIEKDREEKGNHNDLYHATLIVSTAVAILKELKKLEKNKIIQSYCIQVEKKMENGLNPDIYISVHRKRSHRKIIVEVENPNVPERIVLKGYGDEYTMTRIVYKILRYSPHSDIFFISYPYTPHPDDGILREVLEIFDKKVESTIKRLYKEYLEIKGNGHYSLPSIENSHIEGFLLVDYYGNLEEWITKKVKEKVKPLFFNQELVGYEQSSY